ncbi:tetratricopeptide repeat protein [Paracoccaceae bacterium]|nr:tetratricopeptide repeat protein [Paracoccaceae bacterium]
MAEPKPAIINDLIRNLNCSEFEKVISDSEKLQNQYPKSIKILSILATANMALKKSEEAIGHLKLLSELVPNHAEVFFNLGNIYSDRGEIENAIRNYKLAISLKNNYSKALNNLGLIFKRQKEFDKAIECLSNAVSHEPNYAIASNNLGNIYSDLGDYDAAIKNYEEAIRKDPNYFEAYNNLGIMFKHKKNWTQAISHHKKALDLNPRFAVGYHNLGTALLNHKKPEEAIKSYKTAIELQPNLIVAWIHLANLYREQGQNKNAQKTYKIALDKFPNNSILHNNLGSLQQANGEFEFAQSSYLRAIEFDPNYAEAFNNLGNNYQHSYKINEAIEQYTQALSLRPNYYKALCNLAVAHKQLHNFDVALETIKKAIGCMREPTEAFVILGDILRGFRFNNPDEEFYDIILQLLNKKTLVRPRDIASSILSLIKLDPKIKQIRSVSIVEADWEQIRKLIYDLTSFPLFLKLMELCPIPDIEIEIILIGLRSKLLEYNDMIGEDACIIKFQSALALQCFTNEYLYPTNEVERFNVNKLVKHCASFVGEQKQPPNQAILCIASFNALHLMEWHRHLHANSFLAEVINRQVFEPQAEAELKDTIHNITQISDTTSKKVRQQYENNPYPRWINTMVSIEAQSLRQTCSHLKLKIDEKKLTNSTNLKILVAGCGTGQHPIGTASRFKGSDVLAVDLSLSSLAYANRKSMELGITNISYLHGDIFDLHNLDMKFDLIESVGVLHHMANPIAGWKALTDHLNPGGLMKIGLYSASARSHISAVRNDLDGKEIGSDAESIISHRELLKVSADPNHMELLQSSDFYSLSTIKDLIYHVQEHQFTIAQISDVLKKLGLQFCGFENNDILNLFKHHHSDVYDLDAWKFFEQDYPRIFGAMYQFWCQK